MGAFKRKDLKMKKFECKGCVYRKCAADVEQSEIPKYCTLKGYLVTSWHEVKEEQKLPKLTKEVFDRSDCPEWARYAVVNHKGRLSFFADKPKFEGEDYGCWSCDGYGYTHINNAFFDSSDWENSLIERPAKVLSDWVKVGKWGYDTAREEYFEIVAVTPFNVEVAYLDDEFTMVVGIPIFNADCVRANKRPFNDKEMKEIVGKSLETPGFVKFIYSYDKESGTLESHDFLYTAKDLFEDDFKFNGKPCYKLEHLNEKGEWVE